jgi:hypothetical protein
VLHKSVSSSYSPGRASCKPRDPEHIISYPRVAFGVDWSPIVLNLEPDVGKIITAGGDTSSRWVVLIDIQIEVLIQPVCKITVEVIPAVTKSDKLAMCVSSRKDKRDRNRQ